VVFGAHSFIDWTWYVPGDAFVALICAGWLAGRGPLLAGAQAGATQRLTPRRGAPGQLRLALAAAAVAAALLIAWNQWQPKRSEEAINRVDAELTSDPAAALADAHSAVSEDPLSNQALVTLAEVQKAAGQTADARATLQKAVRLQPSNPETWLALARFDLVGNPTASAKEFEASIYLDPQSISAEAIADGDPKAIEVHNDYLQALRASMAAAARNATATRAPAGRGAKGATRRRRKHKHPRSRTSAATP
jgi:tetratricopeptide (TPR) repeat protein